MYIIIFEFNIASDKVNITSDTCQKSKDKITQRLIALIFNKIYYNKNFHIKGNNEDDMKKNQKTFLTKFISFYKLIKLI